MANLSKRGFKILCLSSSLALVLAYNACGAGMPVNVPGYLDSSNDSLASSAVNLSDPTAVQNKALQILADNCTSCHTATSGPLNVFNLTDANHLVQSGLVVPGQPDSSPLLQSIEAGRMPPTGPLSAADKSVLRTWIANGAQPPTVPPSTPPTTLPPPSPTTGTLEERAVAILQNNCYACHGTASNGGVTKINDPAYLISVGQIIPGNATGSLIYDAVVNGRMPVGGMLNQTDLATLADWINQGAKSPTGGTVQPPPALPPLGPSFQSLNSNVFAPKCAGCHAGTTAKGGVHLDTYNNILKYVVKGSPGSSKLYQVTYQGEMPPQPNPALSSEELKAISDWIKAGAPNN